MLKKIRTTKMIAIIGKKMEKADITTEEPVSTVEIIGFATPAVVAVEVKRAEAVVPFIALAVPPPAIIAKAQVITGDKSATVETITAVPAIAANGIAMVSSKLSNQGM